MRQQSSARFDYVKNNKNEQKQSTGPDNSSALCVCLFGYETFSFAAAAGAVWNRTQANVSNTHHSVGGGLLLTLSIGHIWQLVETCHRLHMALANAKCQCCCVCLCLTIFCFSFLDKNQSKIENHR